METPLEFRDLVEDVLGLIVQQVHFVDHRQLSCVNHYYHDFLAKQTQPIPPTPFKLLKYLTLNFTPAGLLENLLRMNNLSLLTQVYWFMNFLDGLQLQTLIEHVIPLLKQHDQCNNYHCNGLFRLNVIEKSYNEILGMFLSNNVSIGLASLRWALRTKNPVMINKFEFIDYIAPEFTYY